MRKLLLLVSVLALFGGSVWASAQFVIDDSGFDYFDADDGYTSITFEDGIFILSFSDHAGPDAHLKIEDIDFLPLDDEQEDEFNAASMLRHLPAEADQNHLEVSYKDIGMETVMADYDAQLTGLGFTSEIEQTHSNQTVMRYTLGDTVARIVFTRHGTDVSVFMHTL